MRFCVLISAICILISSAGAEQPGFDLKEVVRQVRAAGHDPIASAQSGLCPKAQRQRPSAESREPSALTGEFLIDTSIAYVSAPGNQGVPAVAFDGVDFLVVWEDQRSSTDFDIYATRVTPSGQVLDQNGIEVATATSFHWFRVPAVAFDGTSFLVVWADGSSGSYDIYGARVTPQGALLDPSGIGVSTATNFQLTPAVACGGTSCLAVWEDWRSGSSFDVYGARVTPDGTVLDSAGIVISWVSANYRSFPAVAFDGTNFLAVWGDVRSGRHDIYGARVTTDGAVLERWGIAISTAANDQWSPAVAFDGTNFLVVWTDSRNCILCTTDIYGARVSPASTVLDTAGIAISVAPGNQGSPVVSFDGTNFLIVWQDQRSGSDFDIYGTRVTPQGTVLDSAGFVISQAAGDQEDPAIAFDGASSLVVWQDRRSGYSDIYGARVTPAGMVFDSGPVVRQEGNQDVPALARGSGGQMFLVYSGWAGTVGGKTYNTDRIWGKVNPSPGVEETMNEERGTRKLGPTIVRGVLRLSPCPGASSSPSWLLDAAGRKALVLKPGENDIRHLASGVYFVREAQAQAQAQAQAVRKVVVQR